MSKLLRYPLSFGQERLWLLNQLAPGNPVYNIPAVYRLKGSLDVIALERSIHEIVRRHNILRASFPLDEGRPVQVIAPELRMALPVVDLTESAEEEQEEQVRSLAMQELRRPFDLAQGPLWRTSLFRLNEKEHVLVLSMHHIISDGWSMGIFLRELGVLYEAYSAGKSSPLPELAIQYGDFAVWQRQWLQGEVLSEHLAYWRKQLEGAPQVLELPADRPRPRNQTFRGACESIVLSRDISDGLKKLSRRENVTLFMTLLAAFQTLIYRYTWEEDVVVGTPIAVRNRKEFEGLIGFFLNTLALRADLSDDPTFRALLVRSRRVCLEAYGHRDLPFERLVEELNPARNTGLNPLVQVMFGLNNNPEAVLELPGLTVSPVQIHTDMAKFDMSLMARETSQGLSCQMIYNRDLFGRATISQRLRHFQRILEAILEEPNRCISTLPLLTEGERELEISVWNCITRSGHSPQVRIHEMFETQVKRSPDSMAVVHDGKELTYQELNLRSNQVARYLRKLGLGPEVLVGICMERSLDMVIGLLGVLKAGGAYVPLDPAYPPERLAFMLEDSGISILLTQQQFLKELPENASRVVCLDSGWSAIAEESGADLASGLRGENLGYVIYTSGSTGTPKGVAIENRSAAAFLQWALEEFGHEQLSGVLASTSICFDLSIFELLGPLSCGGTVILSQNALSLSELPSGCRVTLLNTVPSAMAELIRIGKLPRSIHTVNLAGEPFQRSLASEIYKQPGIQKVLNLYGPSESTTYSTFSYVRNTDSENPTIGRPIANTQVYMLDGHLEPVPAGVAGELCIGGAGLARGYLNRPGPTAERFIPDRFGGEPGARLYRTGDLARRLMDGDIQFLGRMDHQVKVRGFRIELGEIEQVMHHHGGVRHAAVTLREDMPDKHLVAYFVPNQWPAPEASELRRFLKMKLPEFMIPSVFIPLQKLPMTPNGKIDRRALPAPASVQPESNRAYVVPRTPVEKAVAKIWAEVLHVSQVGAADDFFELGGHSLLAVQVISRVHEILNLDLPLEVLFEKPALEALAATIEERAAKIVGSGMERVHADERQPIFNGSDS